MNIRKPVDYTEMYAALDKTIVGNYGQMQMYVIIGQIVSAREEKGAAVAAAEYLQEHYPDISGFSPRNLRRMREFYRTYAQEQAMLDLAMQIGWTLNVVILEAELTTQERMWYLRQVVIHNWTKRFLSENILNETHLKNPVDDSADSCYEIEKSMDPKMNDGSVDVDYLPGCNAKFDCQENRKFVSSTVRMHYKATSTDKKLRWPHPARDRINLATVYILKVVVWAQKLEKPAAENYNKKYIFQWRCMMANGKIRHVNHMIDTRAIQFLQNAFPVEWVARQMSPDYGIDLDLELFAYEGDDCVTLGEHVYLQVKGTEHAEYAKIEPYGGQSSGSTIDVLKFPIDVSLLKLVERMGSSIPVLLVVVDLKSQQAYQVCLNDYIRYVLFEHHPKFREQGTVTLYIPTENKISNEVFLWYGKRAKLYALFQEIYSAADSCQYVSGAIMVENVGQLLSRIQTHDAWAARTLFGCMQLLYNMLTEMCENDLITAESRRFVQFAAKVEDHWEDVTLYAGSEERPVLGYTLAQEISCKQFLEVASGMSGDYDSSLRHIGLPTTNNPNLNKFDFNDFI